jgi:dynein heavy chain
VLQKLPKAKYTYKAINFNFYTDGIRLQLQLESVLKKQGKTFKPLAGGDVTLLYFVDDLNMPATDPYDTQSAIALIRQSIDYSHWYDRDKVELKMISNTM